MNYVCRGLQMHNKIVNNYKENYSNFEKPLIFTELDQFFTVFQYF